MNSDGSKKPISKNTNGENGEYCNPTEGATTGKSLCCGYNLNESKCTLF